MRQESGGSEDQKLEGGCLSDDLDAAYLTQHPATSIAFEHTPRISHLDLGLVRGSHGLNGS